MKNIRSLVVILSLISLIIILAACNASQPSSETQIVAIPTTKPTESLPPKAANAATAIAEGGITSWKLAIVGDSLVAEDYSNLPGLYAEGIGEDLGITIEINNLGVGGLTCENFLPNLQKYSFNQEPLQESNVILISLGGGDLLLAGENYFKRDCDGSGGSDCLNEALTEFQNCWGGFLETLTTLADPGDTLVRLIITGEFFKQNEDHEKYQAYAEFQDNFYSYQIQSSQAAGITILDLYHFEEPEGFRMVDNVHVSQEGKALIAAMLCDLGYDFR